MKYNAIYSKNDAPLLHILNIGYSADKAITRYAGGERSLYIVHYVISGCGYFNGERVEAGQGFLITPGVPEEYHPDEDDPWEFLWITSPDEKMGDLFEHYKANPDSGIFTYSSTADLKAAARKIAENDNALLSSAQVLEIFLGIFNSHTATAHPREERSADLYFDFSKGYIEANLHTGVRVEALTEIIGISQVYLYKIFMSRTGKSPKQYIDGQKLYKAKRLLKETDMSISEIGKSVGYGDYLSFSRFFSRNTGLSPGNYRIQKKGANER